MSWFCWGEGVAVVSVVKGQLVHVPGCPGELFTVARVDKDKNLIDLYGNRRTRFWNWSPRRVETIR